MLNKKISLKITNKMRLKMHMDLEELTKIINTNPLAKDQYLTQARKTFKITTKWLHRQVMVGIF